MQRYAVLFRVLRDQCAAFARQLCFKTARCFVKAGVNDPAIQTGNFLARHGMLFKTNHRQPPASKFARNGAADDAAGAYNACVKHLSGKSLNTPSTPIMRKVETSAGSLMVHTWIFSL